MSSSKRQNKNETVVLCSIQTYLREQLVKLAFQLSRTKMLEASPEVVNQDVHNFETYVAYIDLIPAIASISSYQ